LTSDPAHRKTSRHEASHEGVLRALVVLPTYNESDNLESIVTAIVATPGFGVLVVDDDSPDGTAAVAEGLARQHPGRVELLHRRQDFGLGRAYREGLGRALERHVPFVFQMDADWSHDPQYLEPLIEAAQHNDLVIGSRYVNGISVVNWPLRRLVLSTFANRYVRAVAGLQPKDCTSGFRCWRREALARIDLDAVRSEGYAFLVELLFAADAAGCRIAEVPIVFVERRAGASKLSCRALFEAAATPWRLCARRLRRVLQRIGSR
jgi:dolichol-phosphate mannosyltransferase